MQRLTLFFLVSTLQAVAFGASDSSAPVSEQDTAVRPPLRFQDIRREGLVIRHVCSGGTHFDPEYVAQVAAYICNSVQKRSKRIKQAYLPFLCQFRKLDFPERFSVPRNINLQAQGSETEYYRYPLLSSDRRIYKNTQHRPDVQTHFVIVTEKCHVAAVVHRETAEPAKRWACCLYGLCGRKLPQPPPALYSSCPSQVVGELRQEVVQDLGKNVALQKACPSQVIGETGQEVAKSDLLRDLEYGRWSGGRKAGRRGRIYKGKKGLRNFRHSSCDESSSDTDSISRLDHKIPLGGHDTQPLLKKTHSIQS